MNQEIAKLSAVSVGDHDPVSGADQRGQSPAGQFHVEHLLLNIASIILGEYGVAAERDGDRFCGIRH